MNNDTLTLADKIILFTLEFCFGLAILAVVAIIALLMQVEARISASLFGALLGFG